MSRASFEQALTPLLGDRLGLAPVPGPRDIPGVRVYWMRAHDLVLQVGVTYHRFHLETFTFDLYLGRTFTFALAAPGYPQPMIRRFTDFTEESASELGFFGGFSAEVAEIAVDELQPAVHRFASQPGFVDAVLGVPLLHAVRDIDTAIIQTVESAPAIEPRTLRLQPDQTKAYLAPDWYIASEQVLVANEGALGHPVAANHVRYFALDAWRCAETSVVDWM